MAGVVVVLGAGFTGQRVARLALKRGLSVVATARNITPFDELRQQGAAIYAMDVNDPNAVDLLDSILPHDLRVLLSIPSRVEQPDPVLKILPIIAGRAKRIVYISTTGVYGAAQEVDANTLPAPQSPTQQARRKVEEAVLASGVPALVLRPAAIYGPGQGIHVTMRAGTYKLTGDGTNYVSRIHVDDLAAICENALYADVTGAYPVADTLPAPAREVARFCADLLHLPMPSSVPLEEAHETLRHSRRVDGTAIRGLLNIHLRYPTYREGIPAAIAAEKSRDL